MSALPPKADIGEHDEHVRFVPKADMLKQLTRERSKHSSSAVQSLAAECPGQQSLRPPAARINHCRPSTMKSSNAVARSSVHAIGGSGVKKAPMTSEMPAMTKARASRFLENLRMFKDCVCVLAACLFSSGGDIVAGL